MIKERKITKNKCEGSLYLYISRLKKNITKNSQSLPLNNQTITTLTRLGDLGDSQRAGTAEHHNVEQGVGSQTVGTVDGGTGGFTRCEQALHNLFCWMGRKGEKGKEQCENVRERKKTMVCPHFNSNSPKKASTNILIYNFYLVGVLFRGLDHLTQVVRRNA